MTSFSTSALLLVLGIVAGPRGLDLLSSSVLLMLDPIIAMTLALLGVFIGLAVDARQPRLTTPAILAVIGGFAIAGLREPSAPRLALMLISTSIAALAVAIAGWLLVGQTDSEREQQVFVIGSLLLLGGGAAYASLSAVFAGLLAGAVWSAAGNLARARMIKHLDYFQHPLLVVMLVAAGASITFSVEALAVVIVVVALHAAGRPVTDPLPISAGAAAIAVAFDVFRGSIR
jgi:hypothetical protein